MTVSDVRKLYNVPKDYVNAHRSSNSQAVANFLNISVNHNDTKLFQKVMAIRPQPAVRFCGVVCFFFLSDSSQRVHTQMNRYDSEEIKRTILLILSILRVPSIFNGFKESDRV